uniref:Exodeoxyribonuclease III Xth n=1 Tax=Diaphorobacter sp. PCA039 TaxID=266831 RepID=C0KGN5_9BURK|nr:exodeoxyribonuclease III Xth [Diaphorobacter sp. PCA039]
MGNVDVAAQDELPLGLQPHEVRMEFLQEAELGQLALLARGAAGEVGADDGQAPRGRVKAQFHVAPLGVELAGAVADDHVAGLVAGIDAHAGVALLHRKMKVALQAGQLLETPLHVRRLGLDFLYANTIRPALGNPCLDPFGRG